MTELTRRNPGIWQFSGVVISASQEPGERPAGAAERRRLFDSDGRLVLETQVGAPLTWPEVSWRAPVSGDSRASIGEVEVARSLRPVFVTTALISIVSGSLTLVLFLLLRTLPLRLLDRALTRATYLATHDSLTGLLNRHAFHERLRQTLALTRRGGPGFAVFCLDLDRFKDVNDAFGHAAGDLVLKSTAARLSDGICETDIVARLGGDEFAIIQATSHPEAACSLAERLVRAMDEPIYLDDQHSVKAGISIGITVVAPGGPLDEAQILLDADLALYQAKLNGRGNYRFFAPEMNAEIAERRELGAALHRAHSEQELRLYFQPQVDLVTRRIVGAEALLRWERNGEFPVPPERFISIAEENGLINSIGTWALQRACEEATTWPAELAVAVNVSPPQIKQFGFFETVRQALIHTGLRPDRLQLEVTESVLIEDGDEALSVLRKMRAMGVRIVMDDFGTGYSSLRYLRMFQFDKIKIDRSFVQQLPSDPSTCAIVRAMIGVGRTLGIRVNAEGIENAPQSDYLLREGCHEAQGFLFGAAMQPEKFALHAARQLLSEAQSKQLC